MKNKIYFLLIFFFIFFFNFFPQKSLALNKVEIYFFWGQGCPHCAQEKPFLEELKQKYPELIVKEFEVYYNRENQELFKKVTQAYKTQPVGVPMTFIGKDFVVGFGTKETTGKQIENLIQNCLTNICPSPEEILTAGGIDKWKPEEKKEFTIPIFGKEIKISSQSSLLFLGTILGLADGINPCMFSVLLFLLTYLLAIGSKKRAIKVGLVFTLGVFVIYFLFMLGMINLISLISFIQKIKIVIAVFALIASLILIKDFFAYGKGISLEIPESAKPTIEKLIKRGTIPSAILLALLSSLVELPCTVGIPLVYTTILAERVGAHIPYLIWYNFFFIIPLLIIITGVALAWVRVEKIEKWRLNFRKYMRLLAGLILLFLAIGLLVGWF